MSLPTYASTGQRVWHYSFRVICGLIFFYLIAPILVIIPLSFNATDFFTFTPEMLRLDPVGYSTKHYEDFFTNIDWQVPLWNSLKIAPMATVIAVALGTLAAALGTILLAVVLLLYWAYDRLVGIDNVKLGG